MKGIMANMAGQFFMDYWIIPTTVLTRQVQIIYLMGFGRERTQFFLQALSEPVRFFGFSKIVDSHRKGGMILAIVVEVQDNLEKALKLLKKKMQLDGLQRELKNRRFYEKPSVKRRRKAQEAERRRRKASRRRRHR